MHPKNVVYGPEERANIIKWASLNPDLSADELVAYMLDYKDENGKDKSEYIGSPSTIRRVLRDANMARPRTNRKNSSHNMHIKKIAATKPNEIFVWDITYLYSSIAGEYFYLYAMMDLYSRKMIHYEVHTEQRDKIAANFLENALRDAKVAIKGHEHEINGFDKSFKIVDTLILHSDNGAPMKGQNMINKVNSLGIKGSYIRPLHSNDNAFIESSFALLKHCNQMRIPRCFENVKVAQNWVNKFYEWYNSKHLHSGIGYITPNDCYEGKAKEILEKRNKKIKESKKKKTRFYDLPGSVSVLSTSKQNRETENVIKAEEYRLGSKVRKAKEKAA